MTKSIVGPIFVGYVFMRKLPYFLSSTVHVFCSQSNKLYIESDREVADVISASIEHS